MIQLNIITYTMQITITSCFVVLLACSTATARPQGTFNNYPYRPTFSDLDPYNNYGSTATNQQNLVRIWPHIIDQAVSPLYNWNWGGNGYGSLYNTNGNGYNTNPNGYYSNGYNPYGYNSNGYNTNGYGYNSNTNGYYNPYTFGYSTANPYGTSNNGYGFYSGKK